MDLVSFTLNLEAGSHLFLVSFRLPGVALRIMYLTFIFFFFFFCLDVIFSFVPSSIAPLCLPGGFDGFLSAAKVYFIPSWRVLCSFVLLYSLPPLS